MLRKLPDKISRFLIYLTAFGVSALMAIMLIHIIKESIPAFSELGIKMFLPSTMAACQCKPTIWTTACNYRNFIRIVHCSSPGSDFRRCLRMLSEFLSSRKNSRCLSGFYRLGCRNSFRDLWIYRTYCPGKKFCHTISYGSRTMYSRCRDCTGNHAAAIRYLDLSRIYSRCTYTI